MPEFSPREAFSRSLGWITESEAQVLASKRVAIAGAGGVGGHYCEVLARLGVGNFRIADGDVFEVVNFNRQNCSGVSTVGKKKVEVLRDRILDINPHAKIEVIDGRISRDNQDAFLEGADLYLDGLDFFALTERYWLFKRMREKGVPAVTVAPVGMGAALLVFTPSSMSFEEYFGISPELPEVENAIRFLLGLAPSLMHARYQADRSRVSLQEHRVPSLPMGGYLCAGVAGSQVLKLLLGRGPIEAAPWSLHYDAYLNRYRKSYVWLGFKNPFQRLKLIILKKILSKKS